MHSEDGLHATLLGKRSETEGSPIDGEDTAVLICRAKRGDVTAGEALLSRYSPLLNHVVGEEAPSLPLGIITASDLRQEACRHFLELLFAYDGRSPVSFGAYLKQKLSWRLTNVLRGERRRQARSMPMPGPEREPAVDFDDGAAIDNPRLRSALRQLSPKQRGVLYRLHWQNKAAAAVAAEWGLTAQAVTGLRRRAEDRLRKALLMGEGATAEDDLEN